MSIRNIFLAIIIISTVFWIGCVETDVEMDEGDADSFEVDGDEEGLVSCSNLCDCPQGWFCNEDGQCEDGSDLLGTPFCCDNPGCPEDAPCVHRDGTPDLCPAVPACTHLCDCPQGWFCNEDGKCDDGTGLIGTPFCCDNTGCTPGAPCVHRDDSYGNCPSCDCDHFTGIYCPDDENVCETVVEVNVENRPDCKHKITFDLDDGSQTTMVVNGCGSFMNNIEDVGCNAEYDALENVFKIACNWCGRATFSKENCSPDECNTWRDCPDCNVCVPIDEVMQCVGMGMAECHSDAECGGDEFCRLYRESQPDCGGGCAPDADAGYILHEWGVNTPHLDGSSGVGTGPARYWGAIPAKPVMYVYADQAMNLDVGVNFASGGTTETWPVLPNGQSIAWNGIDVSKGECVTTPTPTPPWDSFPEDPLDDLEIYQLPNWVVDEADCLTHGETVSKLLFYTGELSSYSPPLTAEFFISSETESATFNVTNNSDIPIGPALLLYRDTLGDCIDPSMCPVVVADLTWAFVDRIDPGDTLPVTRPVIRLSDLENGIHSQIPEGWLALGGWLEDELAYAGLFPQEIEVFMNTWKDMFFGIYAEDVYFSMPEYSNGAFMIYLWPDSHEEEMLALDLDPEPRELSRAMVQYQKVALAQTQSGIVTGTVTLEEYDFYPYEEPIYSGPAPNATVSAILEGVIIAQTTTNEDGVYSLSLPVGTYTISVERSMWEYADPVEGVVVVAGQETVVDLTLISEAMVDKPNLYLYPTETTDVSVRLGLNSGCEVTQSIPEYGGGWDVTVEPSGLIDDEYTYLFYEAEIPRAYPMRSGWSVPVEGLATFFDETLNAYGFTEAETADFLDFWLLHLPPAQSYAVYPLTEPAGLDSLVELAISPAPDVLFRLWLVIAPNETPPELPPPVIEPVERNGFSAVEWGVILN